MKVALTVWGDLISPVFDVAQRVLIARIAEGRVAERTSVTLGPEWPYSRASKLSKMDVRVVICGAISIEFRRMLELEGIRVIPFITGGVEQVLDAYLKGSLVGDHLRMPGFGRGRRRRFRRGSR